MSTTSWIVLGVIVVLVLWIIMIYNQLVAMRQRVGQAFADVDVQLKQRHDLVPNLVEAVRGAMEFEKGTLEAVIRARSQAVQVEASGPEAIKQISQAEDALTGALSRLLAVVEQKDGALRGVSRHQALDQLHDLVLVLAHQQVERATVTLLRTGNQLLVQLLFAHGTRSRMPGDGRLR